MRRKKNSRRVRVFFRGGQVQKSRTSVGEVSLGKEGPTWRSQVGPSPNSRWEKRELLRCLVRAQSEHELLPSQRRHRARANAAGCCQRTLPCLAHIHQRADARVCPCVVVKVTIGPGNITIGLSKSALRALLLEVADNTVYDPEDDLVELSVAACLQRRGHAIRLVVSRDAHGAVHSQDEPRLIQARSSAPMARAAASR